jgi:hypothetical protein
MNKTKRAKTIRNKEQKVLLNSYGFSKEETIKYIKAVITKNLWKL